MTAHCMHAPHPQTGRPAPGPWSLATQQAKTGTCLPLREAVECLPLEPKLPSKQRRPDTLHVPHLQRSRPAPAPRSAPAPQSAPARRSRPAPLECAERLERQGWGTAGRTVSAEATNLISCRLTSCACSVYGSWPWWLCRVLRWQQYPKGGRSHSIPSGQQTASRAMLGSPQAGMRRGREVRQLCQQRRSKGVFAAPPLEMQSITAPCWKIPDRRLDLLSSLSVLCRPQT